MSSEQQTIALILYTYIQKLNQIEALRLQLSQLKSFYPEQGFYFLKNFDKILNFYKASQINPEVMYNQENYFLNNDQISTQRMSDGFILFRNLQQFLEYNRNFSIEEKIIAIALADFTHTTSLAGINYDHFIKIFFPLSDYQARKRLMKMKCIYQNNHIFNKIEPMIQTIFGKILKKLIKLAQKIEELCLRLQSTPYFDPLFLFSKIDTDQKGFLCYNNISIYLTQFNFDSFTYDQYYQLIYKLQGYNCLQTEQHITHLQDEISFNQFHQLIFPKFPYFKQQTFQQQMVNRSQYNDYSQLQTKTGVSNLQNISNITQLQQQQSNSTNPIITNIDQLPKTKHKPLTNEDPYAYKYQIIRAHNSHSPPKYISEAIQIKSEKFPGEQDNKVRYAAVDQYTMQDREIEGPTISKHQVKEVEMPVAVKDNQRPMDPQQALQMRWICQQNEQYITSLKCSKLIPTTNHLH